MPGSLASLWPWASLFHSLHNVAALNTHEPYIISRSYIIYGWAIIQSAGPQLAAACSSSHVARCAIVIVSGLDDALMMRQETTTTPPRRAGCVDTLIRFVVVYDPEAGARAISHARRNAHQSLRAHVRLSVGQVLAACCSNTHSLEEARVHNECGACCPA